MSVRENLLRAHRWRLQERQDYLAGLESLHDRLRTDAMRLQDEIVDHERVAGRPSRDGGEIPEMLRPLIERERKIERSIIEIEAQIAEARTAVNAATQEVKHAEIGAGSPAAPTPRRSRRSRPERTARSSSPLAPTLLPFPDRSRIF